MYRLLNRVQDGATTMLKCVSQFLRDQGTGIVTEETKRDGDALTYVEDLLNLKDRFDHLVYHSFNGDLRMKRMMGTDFEYFLNLNPRFPEYLALFIDWELKRSKKTMKGKDVHKILDKAMMLLSYVTEKELFEQHYIRLLEQRLLHNEGVSDSLEKSVVCKLKVRLEIFWGPFILESQDIF